MSENYVYLIEESYDYEGSSILGIYSTIEKARRAMQIAVDNETSEWKKPEYRGDDLVSFGCQLFSIGIMEVK